MKYLLLTLSIFASSVLCADNYTKEVAEKDINYIPQCKDENNEECQRTKKDIDQFFDAIKEGTGWFSDDYANQPFFKEMLEEIQQSENILPSDRICLEKFLNKLLENNIRNHNVAVLVKKYLYNKQSTHLQKQTEDMPFKEFLGKTLYQIGKTPEIKTIVEENSHVIRLEKI